MIQLLKVGALGLISAGFVLCQQPAFQPLLSSPTQASPTALVSGDFNGDGVQDLARSDVGSHVIAILLGNGDGTFRAAATYPVPSACIAGSLTAADFNNDHKLDLLAICEAGAQLLVYPGRGDGTFAAPVSSQLPFPAFAGNFLLEASSAGIGGAVADFNSDGNLDLVLALIVDMSSRLDSQITNLYFVPGKGDGSFGTPVRIQSGASIGAITTADFNGDHKPDLAFLTVSPGFGTSGLSQTLVIELGNGDGTFHAGASYLWTGASFTLMAADVNGDGLMDLLASGGSLSSRTKHVALPSVITVMLGDGKGNFQPGFSTTDPSGYVAIAFCLADLRGNGPVDLLETLVTGETSASIVTGARVSDGKGGFQALQTFASLPAMWPFASVCTDLNGDGLTDLAFTSVSFPLIQNLFTGAQNLTFLDLANDLLQVPAGDLYVSLNGTPAPSTFRDVNAASYAHGPLAADSIVTAFWNGPSTAKDIGVNVQDAKGVTRPAQLFYASSKQINYALPAGTATGSATITITGAPYTFSAQQQIVNVSPGVFDAGGLAVGNILTVHNGQQTVGSLVHADSSGNPQPTPIDVGSGSDQVFLILYGTGIRHHAQPVTATIGAAGVPVAYAGAQGAYLDEDQINIQLPQSLRGAGKVNLVLNVDGQSANPVTIQIQ